eukprot:gene14385-17013_t
MAQMTVVVSLEKLAKKDARVTMTLTLDDAVRRLRCIHAPNDHCSWPALKDALIFEVPAENPESKRLSVEMLQPTHMQGEAATKDPRSRALAGSCEVAVGDLLQAAKTASGMARVALYNTDRKIVGYAVLGTVFTGLISVKEKEKEARAAAKKAAEAERKRVGRDLNKTNAEQAAERKKEEAALRAERAAMRRDDAMKAKAEKAAAQNAAVQKAHQRKSLLEQAAADKAADTGMADQAVRQEDLGSVLRR